MTATFNMRCGDGRGRHARCFLPPPFPRHAAVAPAAPVAELGVVRRRHVFSLRSQTQCTNPMNTHKHLIRHRAAHLLSALSLFALGGRMEAAVTLYNNRTTFQTAAGAVTVENFEAFAAGATVFVGVPFDFGDFSALNGSPNPGITGDIVSSGVVNGSKELRTSILIGGATFRFTFDSPITALGFDANNLADQRNDNIIFNNSAADVIAIHDLIDQTRFWGFISDTPFTSFIIQQTGFTAGGTSTEGFRIDDLTYTSVPEPSRTALLLIASCALLSRRRFSRRRSNPAHAKAA